MKKQRCSAKTLNFIETEAMNGPIQPNRKYREKNQKAPPPNKLSTSAI